MLSSCIVVKQGRLCCFVAGWQCFHGRFCSGVGCVVGKDFAGPVGGAMLTLCRVCVECVWAVLYIKDGANGVVVNRLK